MNTSLPYEKLTVLENFGHSLCAQSYVYKPVSAEQIAAVFKSAKQTGLKVTASGARRSYNDASLNGGGIVMDMSSMNKVLAWDPETGIITAEPGLTLADLWRVVLPDGWWPPVVSGTMTLTPEGGAAKSLGPGSWFQFTGRKKHLTTCETGADCVLYVVSNGAWDLIPAEAPKGAPQK